LVGALFFCLFAFLKDKYGLMLTPNIFTGSTCLTVNTIAGKRRKKIISFARLDLLPVNRTNT